MPLLQDHSESIHRTDHGTNDTGDGNTQNQRKQNIVSYTEFADLPKRVLHQKKANTLKKQHDADDEAQVKTCHSKVNHWSYPPFPLFRRIREKR